MMLLLQTEDSADNLRLLLKELYESVEVESVIDTDTVLHYNIKTIVSRCTVWLDRLDVNTLRDTLLTTSPVKGKGTCCTSMS